MTAAVLWVFAVGLAGPAASSDLSSVLAKLREPQTLKARFTQTKKSAAFSGPRVVEGRVVFMRPRRLLWKTERPFSTSLRLDGDQVTLRMSKLRRTERFDLSAHPEMRAVFDTLLFFAEADVRRLRGRFHVRKGTSAREILLTPSAEGTKKLMTQLRVMVSPSGRHLDSVELIQGPGETTMWRFHDVELDAHVEPAVFGG